MRFSSLLPRPRLHRPGFDVLTIVSLLLLLAHGLVVANGGVRGLYDQGFYSVVGLSWPGLQEGKLWQFGTHFLFHGSVVHLLFNWLMIYLIGGSVMHILGGRAFAKIFFGGVLAGAILHVLLQPVYPTGMKGEPAFAPLVGASAGAMALLLALTSLSPDSRMWPLPVSGKNLGRGMLLASALLFLLTPGLGIPVLSAAGSWLARYGGFDALFRVSHLAHLGGGLVGFFYARRLMRVPVSLEDLRRARERKEGMAA